MRIFLFCFLFVAAGAWAQTPWSLDDCIRYGVEQNLTLRNKQLDTRIAGENYLGALGRFLPEVGTSGNLGITSTASKGGCWNWPGNNAG